VRNGDPPVHNLFFIVGFWIVFILIGLIGDNRDHPVLLTGLHQLTQVNEPRLRRLACDANTHVRYALRGKIPHHERIELTDTTLGARPINVHADAKLRRITCGRQRRVSINGRGNKQ